MEKVHLNGSQVIGTKAIIQKTRGMAMARCIGLMAVSIKANG